jgi:uncharacterized membrane protein (DUF4010 family)
MVVLISAVSLARLYCLQLVGQRRGVILTGLLGGLVSSTATTLVQARAARASHELIALSRIVIVTASLVGFLRVTVLVAITAERPAPSCRCYGAWFGRRCIVGSGLAAYQKLPAGCARADQSGQSVP